MTSGNTPKIDLRLSPQTQAELEKFLKTMERVKQTTKLTATAFKTIEDSVVHNSSLLQGLKQDMKNFKMISDGLQRNAIMGVGPGSYFRGQEFQAGRRASNTARLGTGIGQQIELQKDSLRLAKQGLDFARKRDTYQEALNLKLGTQARTISKITDLDKARALASAAEVRRGIEVANGESRRARSAERIYDLAKARVQILEQEKRAAEKLAKTEEARQRALQRNRVGDSELEASERQRKLRMLSGDGGAGLFAIQATLMANYVAMSAARNSVVDGVRFTADLDESLRNLQAITVTTDENLQGLKDTILNVSEETKFYATDIANATVTLGQAGFSTKEIQDSVRAVALLATATGTELSKSVDLTTSILGVFNMESAQMAAVADTLTAAVNNSKLNIDKLALGLQYAGNTAAQSGVSFEELTASLGAMANAGIRSGSTLGTGMRQILISLQRPSGKFQETLDRLGITMEEVDLKSNGLYGVMQNLKDSGFTATDAIRSFEVRAASAFNALSGNLGEVVKLERAFLNSSAAVAANETQMRAMSNQGRRLQANLQAVVSTGLEPLAYAVRDTFSWFADFLEWLRDFPNALRVVTTGLTAMAAGFIAVRAAALGWGLIKFAAGLKGLVEAIKGATASMVAFKAATLLAAPILGGIVTVLGAGYFAWRSFSKETKRSSDALQKAQTNFDTFAGKMEDTATQIQMVDDRIKDLTNRSKLLTDNENLLQLETEKVREQFRNMGIALDDNVGSVDELIGALQRLQSKLAEDYELNIGVSAGSLRTLISANERQQGGILEEIQGLQDGRAGIFARRSLKLNALPGALTSMQRAGRSQTLGQQHSNLAELQSYLADLESRGITSGAGYSALEETIEKLQELIRLKETNIAQTRQLADLEDTAANQANRNANRQIVDAVDRFAKGGVSRLTDGLAGKSDPVVRLDAGNQTFAGIQTDALALKEQIEGSNELLAPVKSELLQQLDNAMAEIDAYRIRLQESAADAAETRAELASMTLEAEADRLSAAQKLSQNEGEVDTLGVKLINNRREQFENALEALRVENGGDADSEAYKAGLEALSAEYDADVTAILNTSRTQLASLLDTDLKNLQTSEATLRREMDKALTLEGRQALREDLVENLERQSELRARQNELTLTGAELLAAQSAEAEATTGALEDIAQTEGEDLVEQAEKDVEVAEKALEAVERLADTADSNKDLAELMIARAAALKKYAEARNAQAQIEIETGTKTESEAEAEAADDITTTTHGIDQRVTRATKRVRRKKRGGGGNPYSRKRDEVDKLISDLGAKIDLAENYLIAGQEVSAEYSNVLNDALGKVAEISGQIDTLQRKNEAGGLSKNEQEELNTLIDKQARLTTFIREEEQRIALIKMQQGQYGEGILLTLRSWATENLNMEKTLQGGILSTLNAAKSSISEFFKTISDGTKSGGEAFRDMATGIIRSIRDIFAEMLTVYILQKALGWLGGAIGGDTGKFITDFAGKLAVGGDVKKAATGTYVEGNLNRDSQRYDLMPGEYVLRRSAVQAIGVDELDRLNAMGNRVVATGGHQGAAAQPTKPSGGPGTMNLYLVDDRQKIPSMGPQDVIATVTDDIARNGPTRKFIKAVQMGSV